MKRDIDGGPVQNPRGVREGATVCLKVQESDAHRSTGVVRVIDSDGRYALVEWTGGYRSKSKGGKRSHHTLRDLAPA